MFSFFDTDKTADTRVVRSEERIRIINGRSNCDAVELGYDLLSPDLKGAIQLCEMTLGPYKYSSKKLDVHDAEEVAVCIKASIELHLEDEIITLNKGDSVRIEKGTPHRWKNPTEKQCAIIFAMTPPLF
ncbi:MAG TPA: cupin domain-containing protein [Tissierellaceae bacterium]|nr:cupin domain-containing protein [Tissierellaceae bacterium]